MDTEEMGNVGGWVPTSERLFVEPDLTPEEVKTESGLVVAQKKASHLTGVVKALAYPMGVPVGARVMYPANVPREVRIDGKLYHSVTYDQLLGVKSDG